jgi:septal ring factor EnvC (AmiA/AmiB activator)
MPASGHRALSERLAEAEQETPAPRPAAARPAPHATSRSRAGLIIAILVVLVLLAALAGVGALAYSNKTRADGWEARAFRLERNTEQLNGLLIERSTQLSERTTEVNRLAAKVTRQQNALTRSESDVASLSQRQRELAAEKARVEDSRAELQVQSTVLKSVANSFVECKDGLVALLGYVIQEDNAAASRIVDGVAADCSTAESSLARYRARYG